ncbi:MAG: hypothetical protein R2707_04115 [Acidimicrobiales bacterium]
MHATVLIAGGTARTSLSLRRGAPRTASTLGLRYSVVATAAPLGTGVPRPQFGRATLVAFWDDAEAADAGITGPWSSGEFEGLRIDATAERAIGSWPGVPTDLPTGPEPLHDGAVLVITIGRLRLLQAPRFFRAGAKAERHILASPGLTWATGLAAPERRTLFTVSWWHDQAAMDATVRGAGDHRDAMTEQARKDFHHESAFIRFRPVAVRGSLQGKNGVADLVP